MYSSNLLPLHVHCRELETAAGKIRPVLILCEIIIIPLYSVEKNGNCSNYYYFFAYVHIIIVVISQMQTLSSQKGILRNPTFSCMLALWFVLQALTRAELNVGESLAHHQPQLTSPLWRSWFDKLACVDGCSSTLWYRAMVDALHPNIPGSCSKRILLNCRVSGTARDEWRTWTGKVSGTTLKSLTEGFFLFNISLIHGCCQHDNCQKDMQGSCFGNHHWKLGRSPLAGSMPEWCPLQRAVGSPGLCLQGLGWQRAGAGWTVQSALPEQHLSALPGWLAKLKMPWHKTAGLYPPHKFAQGLGVF